MEIKAICQECGKEYDNFMRTFKVKNNDKELIICRDCQDKYKKMAESNNEIWFLPHIPAFCDGGDLTLRIFKNIKDFTDFLNTIPSKKEKIVYDDKGVDITVMTIDKSGKNWWVHGYTNTKLKELGYDYWENHAKIKEN